MQAYSVGVGDAPLSLMVFRVDPPSTDRREAPDVVRLALTYFNAEGNARHRIFYKSPELDSTVYFVSQGQIDFSLQIAIYSAFFHDSISTFYGH